MAVVSRKQCQWSGHKSLKCTPVPIQKRGCVGVAQRFPHVSARHVLQHQKRALITQAGAVKLQPYPSQTTVWHIAYIASCSRLPSFSGIKESLSLYEGA